MLFFNRQKQQMKYKIFSTNQAEILIVDIPEHSENVQVYDEGIRCSEFEFGKLRFIQEAIRSGIYVVVELAFRLLINLPEQIKEQMYRISTSVTIT